MKYNGEDKFLVKQTEERILAAIAQNIPQASRFLSGQSLSDVLNRLKCLDGNENVKVWGGYEGAERKIIVTVPSYMTLEEFEPLKVVRVFCTSKEQLAHGQYLGSILGLGISRQLIGDIGVLPDGANVIVLSEIADFIAENLNRVGSVNVRCQVTNIGEIEMLESSAKEVVTTVASLRLDVITAAAFGTSRGKAAEAIKSGVLFVDDIQKQNIDFNLSEGSKITWRGKGRARIEEIVGNTKKGRISIKLSIQRRK